MLCVIGAEKCGEGHAPALRVVAKFGEILLEGEADVLESATGRNDFADGFGHRVDRAMEGGFLGEEGLEAPCHEAASIGVTFKKR